MLEAIGGLSIVAIGVYLVIKYHENKETNKSDRDYLIRHSWACKILIQDYDTSLKKGKPIMTKNELDRKIDEILNNKSEKEEIKKSIKRKEDYENEVERDKRNKRKIGYKYEQDIFNIFFDNRELNKEKLIVGIQNRLNVNDLKQTEDIFGLWLNNNLISNCAWNSEMFEIGSVLTSSYYQIDEDDLIWKDWLSQNNIKLKAKSKELENYFEDDLVF